MFEFKIEYAERAQQKSHEGSLAHLDRVEKHHLEEAITLVMENSKKRT